MAAVLRVPGELLGQRRGDHVQHGRDQDPVPAEVARGGDDVGPHAQREQGGVPVERLPAVVQERGGVGVLLARPPRVPVEDDAHRRGLALAARDRGERAQGPPERGHGAEEVAVLTGVRHHRRVVLLGPGGRLAPLEEAHGVGAVRDVQQRVPGQLAGPLRHVDRLPVDGARGVLHEEPRAPARDAADQVGGEGQLVPVLRSRQDVVVVGDEVDLAGPVGVVHALGAAHHHEVGGDGHTGGDLAQQVPLGAQVLLERVGGEPLEVELLRGVGVGRGEAGREDLLPLRVVLRPERRAPGVVEGVQRGVAGAQPVAEGAGGVVGEVVDVVAAELVVDVPGHQRRVVLVPLGQGAHQPQRVPAEHRRGGPPVLPRPRPHRLTGGGHREDLRVRRGEPGRRGGGGGPQVHRDPAGVQQVHDLVQPAEVPLVLGLLQPGPGEDADGDDVHARLAHQADVLPPHLARPLLGVVVGAVREAAGGVTVRPVRQQGESGGHERSFRCAPGGAACECCWSGWGGRHCSTVKPCSSPYFTEASCQAFRPSVSLVPET